MDRFCILCGNKLTTKWQTKFCTRGCANKFSKGVWDFTITPEIHEEIEGCLLADGGLEWSHTAIYPYFSLLQGTGHKEYCEYFANLLGFDKERVTSRKTYYKKYDKYYDSYRFRSKTLPIFQEYYNRWYPNGKKVIPEDFKLTPKSLLHAYLGDGCFGNYLANKKFTPTTYYVVCLHLQGFTINELEKIIIPQFKQNIGIEPHIYLKKYPDRTKQYPYLQIMKNDDLMTFFKYLPKNPIRCYDYKFKFDCI